MSKDNFAVRFLYGTKFGNSMLRLVMNAHVDRAIVKFLWSGLSKPLIGFYIKNYNIDMSDFKGQTYRSFREFFIRKRDNVKFDKSPFHLISPCDSLLSAFPIAEDSRFSIKGASYALSDILKDDELAKKFHGGDCLIFRLCSNDYHRYCYIDNCYHGKNHYIEGELHSVQPSACDAYPVYTVNRRMWTLLETEHFGPVIQTAVGAFVVGGIVNVNERKRVAKAEEMGYFDLAGSTLVLLFQKDRISLLPELAAKLTDGKEVRVKQGMHIANKK